MHARHNELCYLQIALVIFQLPFLHTGPWLNDAPQDEAKEDQVSGKDQADRHKIGANERTPGVDDIQNAPGNMQGGMTRKEQPRSKRISIF